MKNLEKFEAMSQDELKSILGSGPDGCANFIPSSITCPPGWSVPGQVTIMYHPCCLRSIGFTDVRNQRQG